MRLKGPWSVSEISAFLEASIIPVRIGVVRPSGEPVVLSLWFLPEDMTLLCATSRDAYVIDLLRRDPRCAFEVASDQPPYKGVRGQGFAKIDDSLGVDVLQRLLHRYSVSPNGKLGRNLLARASKETSIRILLKTCMSWDFTSRMTE